MNLNFIAPVNCAFFQNFCKHAFARHDTISGHVVDGAFMVTFFADLGNLDDNRVSQLNPGAQGQGFPVNPDRGNVLRKISKGHVKALIFDTFDTFR